MNRSDPNTLKPGSGQGTAPPPVAISNSGQDLEVASTASQPSVGRSSLPGTTQRRSDVMLAQNTSEDEPAIPIPQMPSTQRSSLGAGSNGQGSLQAANTTSQMMATTGSACGSTGTTQSSTELETTVGYSVRDFVILI